MSAEKPIEWHQMRDWRLRLCIATVDADGRDPVFIADATRADLDKALERLELRAVAKDEVPPSDWAESMNRLFAERNAAIAAKEAAEKGCATAIGVQHDMTARFRRMNDVVEAARSYCGEMRTMGGSSTGQLDAALRALDAGEAPKPSVGARVEQYIGALRGLASSDRAEFTKLVHARISDLPEESRWSFDDQLALGIEQLRSALARAEEELEGWKSQAAMANDTARVEMRVAHELRAENDKVRSELAAIVERTARAQREACADTLEDELGARGAHIPTVCNAVRATELVTLATLPEADSSGGGKETKQPLCRHCGGTKSVHEYPVPLGHRFDPAPPKSEEP